MDAPTARGRHSFIAAWPFATLLAEGTGPAGPPGADPFLALRDELARYPLTRIEELPPFQTGAAGYWGYELATRLERLPEPKPDDLTFPDQVVGLFDVVIGFDHARRAAWIVSSGYPERSERLRERRARERLAMVRASLAAAVDRKDEEPALRDCSGGGPPQVESNFTAEEFRAAVARVIEYIRAGDLFQANLAQRFRTRLGEGDDPFALYRRLTLRNPAPFSAYLDLGGRQIVSSSPERFLSVSGRRIETRPIKGTRPRGASEAEDARLVAELLASEKDRAENVMIVDLLRNDLSRVCLPHSIGVPQLCALESFASVHHLVSEVVGELAPDATALDALRACFPGGSITGAPKIRAMEIIHELEPNRRGPYCGAIGYAGFDGSMDTSIAIRTIVISGREGAFHAGGGIVADSDPTAEYEETLTKALALRESL